MQRKLLQLIPLAILASCTTFTTREPSPEFGKWAAIKTPLEGPPSVYGTYQKGCVAGAQSLPLTGEGYFVVHQSQARYFGHPAMISYLTQLGKKLQFNKFPSMLVEDISYPRGGPFLTGHNSHQVGLDVDISLQSVKKAPTPEESEAWISPSYVFDRKNLLPNWQVEQIRLTVLATDAPEVNRVFVAPAIKKYFCVNSPDAPWLHKLRAWWGHDDHLHVRLTCPVDSPDCVNQAPLDPKNNGCGAELDWWYSAEADAEAKKMEEPAHREFPVLPPYCETVQTAL